MCYIPGIAVTVSQEIVTAFAFFLIHIARSTALPWYLMFRRPVLHFGNQRSSRLLDSSVSLPGASG